MPFKADLDRCPIDVPADTYMYVTDHSPVAAIEAASAAELADSKYESIISAQVTVPASVKTLAELLLAVETEVEEVIALGVGDTEVLEYSGQVVLSEYTTIVPGQFDISVELTGAGSIFISDVGDGTLIQGAHTGLIDYVTGEWSIVISGDTVVDNSDISGFYTVGLAVPAATPAQGLWMSPGVADAIYATYSEDGEPTAATGILLAEPVFLAGQPDLIANAKFFGADTLMDVEVMI